MKKKKILVAAIVAVAGLLNFFIASNVKAVDSTVKLEMSTASAKGEWFNPTIPFPYDPCDTGGNSACYGN
ncbi:MAG: hypothetical protein PHI28_10740 [Mangrovibacterium sp.]|nr:hypothetical protein [Mangrovibacterium sp.]